MLLRAAARLARQILYGSTIRCIIGCIVLGSGFGGWASDAAAQFIVQSMSGTLTAGQTDTYGYFGPPGADVGGLQFGVIYTYSLDGTTLIETVSLNGSSYTVIDLAGNGSSYFSFAPGVAGPAVFNSTNQSISLSYDTTDSNPSIQNPSTPLIGGALNVTLTSQGLQNFEILVGNISSRSCSSCSGLFFNSQNTAAYPQPIPVTVGQQITLVAQQDGSTNTQSWSVLNGSGAETDTIVQAYSFPPGSCSGLSCGLAKVTPVTTKALSNPVAITFYFVIPGTYKVFYSPTLTASFVVDGPTGDIKSDPSPPKSKPVSASGNLIAFDGITFDANETNDPNQKGYFFWIQKVVIDSSMLTYSNGSQNYTASSGLDNSSPYSGNYMIDGKPKYYKFGCYYDVAKDAPGRDADDNLVETRRNFSANMYLMWNAGSGLSGVPAPNTIPVVVGFVRWYVNWDFVKTSSGWIPKPGAPPSEGGARSRFIPARSAADLPEWKKILVNSSLEVLPCFY